MSNLNEKLLAGIKTALNVFDFEELRTAVTTSLIGIDWDKVKNKIKTQNLKYTKNAVVKSTIETLKEDDYLTLKRLQIQLFNIMLLGRMLHSGRYQWNANRMSGDVQLDEMSLDELRDKIKTACKKCKLYGTFVKVKYHDSLYWMLLALERSVPSPKKRKGGRQATLSLHYKDPYFFIYKPQTKYLLSSKKAYSQTMSQVLAITFGAQSVKSVALFGYHVESLFRMLRNKRSYNEDYEDTYEEEVPIMETSRGINFTGNKKRAKYATDVFTDNPPNLRTLTIMSDEAKWSGVSEIPELEGEPFESSISFSGPNVFEMIKDMTKIGMIRTPYPGYIHNLLTTGRNVLNLKCPE